MSTKPPAAVQEHPADSLEKVAYGCAAIIPTEELNDQYRLGYHIWRWLNHRNGTIEEAITESGSRLRASTTEAARLVEEYLKKAGIIL